MCPHFAQRWRLAIDSFQRNTEFTAHVQTRLTHQFFFYAEAFSNPGDNIVSV